MLRQLEDGDADASQDDGVWIGDELVGLVTSGAYGHHVGASLALAHVDQPVIDRGDEVAVYVIGEPRRARILPETPYDPKGARLREIYG